MLRQLNTESDIGCVTIGSDDWSFNVPNGYGDGVCEVFIEDEERVDVPEDFQFVSSFNVYKENTVGLYHYDCNCQEAIYYFAPGRWAAYMNKSLKINHGRVYFVRWN